MSTHKLILRALAAFVGSLLPIGALLAQQTPPPPACREIGDAAPPPPNVTASIRGEFLKDKTLIQDIFLASPDGSRIRAFVIRPFKPSGESGGAAFFLHWLGGPPANDRAEFFEDAVQLADHNVTSLLVDAPWAEPEWFSNRKLEEDLASTSQYAAQLQGYFRYLMAQAKPNGDKVAFVGHDFGAMYGALLLRRESAIRHAVVMAAVGDFGDWFVLGRKMAPADSLRYRERMSVAAPTRYLRCASSVDLLFQFAENDRFVSREQAAALVAGAPAAKNVLWYPGGHELQDASRKDRLEWLIERIGTPSGHQ
jgi:hypothetical protein